MDFEFDIIGKLFRFNPVQNTKLSYAGNFYHVLSNLWVLISLNIFIIFIMISGYSFYKTKNEQTSHSVKVIMNCGLAGAICSLIDKAFWGGSLDFLQIHNFFICDLKDCYLTIAEILFVIIGILHNREISIKEYLCFCYGKLKR